MSKVNGVQRMGRFFTRYKNLDKNILWEIILSILRMTHRMISFKNNQKKREERKK